MFQVVSRVSRYLRKGSPPVPSRSAAVALPMLSAKDGDGGFFARFALLAALGLIASDISSGYL